MDSELAPFFQPLRINDLTLANRFIMPAMQRGMIDRGGPDARHAEIFRRCAAGEVSLIISEATMIDHPSARWRANTWMGRDSEEPWRRCIDQVKSVGGKIFVQLGHPGAVRPDPVEASAHATLSPSGFFGEDKQSGRAMTRADLADMRDAYARSARLAQEFGADGVEIHCAHGYLLDQFLWSVTNRRTDDYGGPSLAERGRFPAEVVAAVRDAVGPRFPISIRLSQFKEIDYAARIATAPDELRTLIELLRRSGVDLFHMSSRRFYQPAFPESDLSLAGWTKSFTDAAVITVGSVGLDNDVFSQFLDNEGEARPSLHQDLARLARRMAAGEFDLVAIGRSLIADSDWVRKVRTGGLDAITPFQKSMLQRYLDDLEPGLVELERGTEIEKSPETRSAAS